MLKDIGPTGVNMETTESRSVLWHYNEMYKAYKKGLVTEYEWQYYCTEMLSYRMEEHADVFKRLKVRGE